jgi:hypothetical protein
MTYREACARIGVLPGASQEQARKAAERRLDEVAAAWKVAKTALTKAEDDVVEIGEIFRAIDRGEERL